MILLEVGNLLPAIILIYLVCHIPAFILLIIGLIKRRSSPNMAKKLFIAAGIYFLIGGGICGSLFMQ